MAKALIAPSCGQGFLFGKKKILTGAGKNVGIAVH